MKTYEVLYLKSRGVTSFTEKIEADSAESAYAIAIKEPKCPDCAMIAVFYKGWFTIEQKEFDNPNYTKQGSGGAANSTYTVTWKKQKRGDVLCTETVKAKKIEEALEIAIGSFPNSEFQHVTLTNDSPSMSFDKHDFENPHYVADKTPSKLSMASTTIKQSLTSIKLPKIEFQDSGWILLYRIAGWLCVGVGVGVLIAGLASDAGSSTEEGLVFFCCALLAASANFFAAHILRLQEKTAAFTEVTAGIMEKHHELMVENVNLLRSIAQKTEDKG